MTAAVTDRIAAEVVDRVVGRLAKADEAAAVEHLLTSYSTSEVPEGTPILSVVALAEDQVVGVAAAWEGAGDGPAQAALAIAPDWLGYGVGRFLARMLALELGLAGVTNVVPAPHSAKHAH